MEFIPICIECENFMQGGKCPHYQEVPIEIKNREVRCDFYSGDDENYILFTRDSKPEKEDM